MLSADPLPQSPARLTAQTMPRALGSIRAICTQLICDELIWDKAIFLQQLAHQFKRRPFVPPSLDQNTLKEIKDLLRNFCKQGA
jgi:hypothetical protein